MTSRPDRWGWWVAAVVAALAVWIDLSPIHAYHTSDSFVPVFASLYRWTPFFWEQNRFGSLIPLLSLGIDSPFANLLFQVGLRLLAVVASFFLLARTVVPRPYWPAVGALTLALWLGGQEIRAHAFVQMQPYGQAVALSLAGLLLLESRSWWRVAVGIGLLLLAFWISLTTLFWLFPLVVARHFLLRPGRTVLALFAVVFSFGASLVFSRLSVYRRATSFSAADPGDWPLAWRTLAERSMDYLSLPLVLAALGLLVAALLLRRRLAFSAGLCLLVVGLGEVIVMGTTYWAKHNGWSVRYVAVELLALGTLAPALALVFLLEDRPERWHRIANALGLTMLLLVAVWRYGEPSVTRARAALDQFGEGTDEILASGSTHLLGGYWRAWPAGFHANVVRWERGETTPVWVLSLRSRPTEPLWRPRDWAGARIAVLRGDETEAEEVRHRLEVPPLELAEDLGEVRVYTAK
ncbi:MAG TPA: hypothetical protein VN493_06195 [Thermoanaerobaculia bacterium]|nr:hypothetical protein [Thermoanaerobaculia bacterium]